MRIEALYIYKGKYFFVIKKQHFKQENSISQAQKLIHFVKPLTQSFSSRVIACAYP